MRQAMRHRAPAQVLAWHGLLMFFVLLPLLGLAIDSGLLFTAHRRLQMVADGAARVGAMQVDPTAARDTDRVALDPAEAQDAAEAYLRDAPGVAGTAWADTERVQVRAERQVPLPFQRLFGRGPMQIQATASAVPCSGIAEAEGPC